MSENRRQIRKFDLNVLFDSLPNPNDDNYSFCLKDLVVINKLDSKQKMLNSYLSNETNKKEYRFAAFYLLLIIARRIHKYTEYNDLVDKYANQFAEYDLYNVAMSTYYINKNLLGDKNALNQSIRYAAIACEKMASNLAVKHHFAELIALAIEENKEVSKKDEELALKYIEEIIHKYSDQAKFHCTRGRLQAIKGKYLDSISSLRKALELENGEGKDSMIRIARYNFYLQRVQFEVEEQQVKERLRKTEEAYKEMQKKLDASKTQYLEYLAFFAGILSFILSTVSIVGQLKVFNECVGLILVFSGSLLEVFISFRAFLTYDKEISNREKLHGVVVIFLGILLIAAGCILGYKLK